MTAMLCWFDEPVELLEECVAGAATIVDRIVAADGAYELVADKQTFSPPEQARVIEKTARMHNLGCEFLKPQIWPGQVAKRDAVLQRAKQGSEWVMALDADWVIRGDRQAIRDELRQLHEIGCDQVAVRFVQPENPEKPLDQVSPSTWHDNEVGEVRDLPLIYRVMPVMNYRLHHWVLLAEDFDGRMVGLWGGEQWRAVGLRDGTGYRYFGIPGTALLKAPHLFEHRCLFREEKQIDRNRAYIVARDEGVKATGYET